MNDQTGDTFMATERDRRGAFVSQFKDRTRAFALRVIRLVDALSQSRSADVLDKQLLRSATSVGANYRAACRARSKAEFLAKLGIVEEECDESMYWLELIISAELLRSTQVEPLLAEANEILSVCIKSIQTARARKQSPTP